jgi:hypothetical protein
MDPDPLQWLWDDGVSDFKTKFNDLQVHTRKIRNFHLPFDTAQHDANCGLNNEHHTPSRMQCSCCKGAWTFEEERHVKNKLTGQRAVPNEKERNFKGVPAVVCWGIENCKELFGLGSDKEALSAVFEAGTNDTKRVEHSGSAGAAHTASGRLARRCCFRFKPAPLAIYQPPALRTLPWH